MQLRRPNERTERLMATLDGDISTTGKRRLRPTARQKAKMSAMGFVHDQGHTTAVAHLRDV
jgi:hypothetical protein